MTSNKENQCIIISGESGAGKTEASKIILGFIAAASKQSKDVEAINELLLHSNPIMEAFGNGKAICYFFNDKPKLLVTITQVVSESTWKLSSTSTVLLLAEKSPSTYSKRYK
jgi:ABC-type glutathione transport system ATPase component